MDVHAQLSQLSPEARAALARKIKMRLVAGDSRPGGSRCRHRRRGRRGAHPRTGASPRTAGHAASHHRAARPPGTRDHPHGRRVDSRDRRAVPARSPRIGRPSEHLAAPQNGVANVFLARWKCRHRPTDGTRQLRRSPLRSPTRSTAPGWRTSSTDAACRKASKSPLAESHPSNSASEDQPHTVLVQHGDTTSSTTTRWVVDASGRNRALPRQLGPQARQRAPLQCRLAARRDRNRHRPVER